MTSFHQLEAMKPAVAIPKLFWPSHLCTKENTSGFLVGWNSSEFVYTVATVVSHVSIVELEHLLSRYSAESDPIHTFMNETCGAAPTVLGLYFIEYEEPQITSIDEYFLKRRYEEWIVVKKAGNYMTQLKSIRYRTHTFKQLHPEIVFYDQPNPITAQYLSLDPIILNVYERRSVAAKYIPITTDKLMMNIEMHYPKVMVPLRDGLKEHHINYILNQINFTYSLEKLVNTANLHQLLKMRPITHSHKEDVILSQQNTEKKPNVDPISGSKLPSSNQRWLRWFHEWILQCLIMLLFLFRCTTGYITQLANVRLPYWLLDGHTLNEVSALMRQMELRLRQICLWPSQFIMLRRKGFRNTIVSRAYFIR
jgi:phosphatidylinositol glycan class Q protein